MVFLALFSLKNRVTMYAKDIQINRCYRNNKTFCKYKSLFYNL